jgi:formate/nitrite transporter FocA (FNT family)
MKRNWGLIFLDILFICLFVYGIYRYTYTANNRVLVIRISMFLFAYIGYEHYKLYKNQKRVY